MDFIFETKLVQTGPKTTVEAIEQDLHGISLEFFLMLIWYDLKSCSISLVLSYALSQ